MTQRGVQNSGETPDFWRYIYVVRAKEQFWRILFRSVGQARLTSDPIVADLHRNGHFFGVVELLLKGLILFGVTRSTSILHGANQAVFRMTPLFEAAKTRRQQSRGTRRLLNNPPNTEYKRFATAGSNRRQGT